MDAASLKYEMAVTEPDVHPLFRRVQPQAII